jgi:hypothetical protein
MKRMILSLFLHIQRKQRQHRVEWKKFLSVQRGNLRKASKASF